MTEHGRHAREARCRTGQDAADAAGWALFVWACFAVGAVLGTAAVAGGPW